MMEQVLFWLYLRRLLALLLSPLHTAFELANQLHLLIEYIYYSFSDVEKVIILFVYSQDQWQAHKLYQNLLLNEFF
jgi:hypothetical protein